MTTPNANRLKMGVGILGIWALYIAPSTLLGMVFGMPWWLAALAGLILGEWAGVVIFICGLWLFGIESWWVLFLGGAVGGAIWSVVLDLWFLMVVRTASLTLLDAATKLPARVRRKIRIGPPEPDSESQASGPLPQDHSHREAEAVTTRLWCVACDIDVLEDFFAAQHNPDFSCSACGKTFDYIEVLEAVGYREQQAFASHIGEGQGVDDTREFRVEGLKVVVEIDR